MVLSLKLSLFDTSDRSSSAIKSSAKRATDIGRANRGKEVFTEQQRADESLLKISSIAYRLSDNPENKKQLASDILRLYRKLSPEQLERFDYNNPEIRQLVCQLIEEKNKSQIKPAEKPKPDAKQLSIYSECEFYYLLARQNFDYACAEQSKIFLSALEKFTIYYSQLSDQQLQAFTTKHLEQKCAALNTQLKEAESESNSLLKIQYRALVFERMNNLKLFLYRVAAANPDSATRFKKIADLLRTESEPVV